MSLGQRLSALFRSRQASDDDPRAALDASYEAQRDLLAQSRRGAADVATSRKRVELQLRQLQLGADRLEEQAQAAVDRSDEGAAREALVRRSALTVQAGELGPDLDRLAEQESRLTVQVQRLEAKVEAFRTQKETLTASYTAAEAHGRIGEAYAGISEELDDVGLAVGRMRERTEAMQARADAVESLAAPGGALPWESAGDRSQRELAAMAAGDDVEQELARLRSGRLAAGPAASTSATAKERR